MPQIIINRPPRTSMGASRSISSDVRSPNADVTVTDGGSVVSLPNTDYVRITVTQGQTEIQTEDEKQG